MERSCEKTFDSYIPKYIGWPLQKKKKDETDIKRMDRSEQNIPPLDFSASSPALMPPANVELCVVFYEAVS